MSRAAPNTVNVSTPGDPFGLEEPLLNNVGRIPKLAFSITCGLFFGLACIAIVARTVIRLVVLRKLGLDDYFLIIGICCLAAGTACLYQGYETIFVIEAVTLNPTSFIVPPEDYPLLEAKLPVLEAFLTATWTATHAVKASFLALFRQLITRTGKGMRVWWWCAAGVTTVSWIFFAIEPFMLCPYSTAEISKCLPGPPYATALGLTALGTCLDIISDSMIVSIPILLLRKTQMNTSQKFGLAVFMCLSLFMICIAFVRVGGFGIPAYNPLTQIYSSAEDIAYDVYWVFLESCIAHIMASLSIMRTVLNSHSTRSHSSGSPRRWYSMRSWKKPQSSEPLDDGEPRHDDLPPIPKGSMTGMKTFIRRNGRDPGLTTIGGTTEAFHSTQWRKHRLHGDGRNHGMSVNRFEPWEEGYEMHSGLIVHGAPAQAVGSEVSIAGHAL